MTKLTIKRWVTCTNEKCGWKGRRVVEFFGVQLDPCPKCKGEVEA